jgi:hypothetical protein
MVPLRLFQILFCSVLVAIALFACGTKPETAIDVSIDGRIPPSFSFAGNWWASEFVVLEMPPARRDSAQQHDFKKDKKIWSVVDPDPPPHASYWPKITYGVVPSGFMQKIPELGSPPPLEEGKIYSAQAIDNIGNGGLCFFVIQNGRSVRIRDSEVFRETK